MAKSQCFLFTIGNLVCVLFQLLGRFHAFEKAHKMDPKSTGRGVRQFKTYLLHRLEKVDFITYCCFHNLGILMDTC